MPSFVLPSAGPARAAPAASRRPWSRRAAVALLGLIAIPVAGLPLATPASASVATLVSDPFSRTVGLLERTPTYAS